MTSNLQRFILGCTWPKTFPSHCFFFKLGGKTETPKQAQHHSLEIQNPCLHSQSSLCHVVPSFAPCHSRCCSFLSPPGHTNLPMQAISQGVTLQKVIWAPKQTHTCASSQSCCAHTHTLCFTGSEPSWGTGVLRSDSSTRRKGQGPKCQQRSAFWQK